LQKIIRISALSRNDVYFEHKALTQIIYIRQAIEDAIEGKTAARQARTR